MKPFDLKAALSGEPVMWPDEKVPMTFVSACITYSAPQIEFRGGEGHKDSFAYVDADGCGRANSGMKLVMAPRKVKKTRYVMIGQMSHGILEAGLFKTREEAEGFRGFTQVVSPIVPIEIEVEE